jgi:hypothetical protein
MMKQFWLITAIAIIATIEFILYLSRDSVAMQNVLSLGSLRSYVSAVPISIFAVWALVTAIRRRYFQPRNGEKRESLISDLRKTKKIIIFGYMLIASMVLVILFLLTFSWVGG